MEVVLAYLAKPLIKWGIIAAVIAALAGWAIWERHDAIAAAKGEQAAQIERDAYKAQLDAFAATHADDVAQMNTCKSVLADQSDAVAKLQFSLDEANAAAQHSAEQADADTKALTDRVGELQAWAASHQDKVCKLSPEMQDRARSLWK